MSISAGDLAAGDSKALAFDLSRFQIDRIRSVDDPLFAMAYAALWAEFGAQGEMELPETLQQRFSLAPGILYEIFLLRCEGRFAGVRDHTAIPADGEIIVHLSHNLVAPEFRRTGLAGWMRALPLESARECAAVHGFSPEGGITLVAEMEYESAADPASGVRLSAYQKAGFHKVDPEVVAYHQPDFLAPEQIDASGGARPIPFQLLLRQLGREDEREISGARLRKIVAALYKMYAAQFRPEDMAHPALRLAGFPPDEARIRLLAPRSSFEIPRPERP